MEANKKKDGNFNKLRNVKFYVDGKGEQVYNQLIKLGYKPPRKHYSTYDICQPFVYIGEGKSWEYGYDMLYFTNIGYREIKVTEVLNMEQELR